MRNNLIISSCKIYSLNQDLCFECEDGYIITGDGLKCLPLIQNCFDYN